MSTCQVRPWKELVPFVSHLENAYRARKDEDDALLPHSFLFRRRDCGLNVYLVFFFKSLIHLIAFLLPSSLTTTVDSTESEICR